jgi:phage terminase small subunit
MKKKLAEENVVVVNAQHLRLKPPAYLNKHEREIFEHVVNHSEPSAFKQRELLLLAAYCTAAALCRYYSQAIGSEGDRGQNHKCWVENARLLASLSTRLRLSPQSRYDARQAQRNSETVDLQAPWDKYGA